MMQPHIRIAASDGSVWDIPAANVHLARERDPGLRTLPPDDLNVLALTPEDEAWLWELGVELREDAKMLRFARNEAGVLMLHTEPDFRRAVEPETLRDCDGLLVRMRLCEELVGGLHCENFSRKNFSGHGSRSTPILQNLPWPGGCPPPPDLNALGSPFARFARSRVCDRRTIDKPKRPGYNAPMIPREARKWLAAIGRKGGSATSKAKAAAARRNGRKGGRPRKAKR